MISIGEKKKGKKKKKGMKKRNGGEVSSNSFEVCKKKNILGIAIIGK